MATSKIPDVVAWLVPTFTTAPTLGAADPPVLVLDGPEVANEAAKLILWVGVDDPDDLTPLGAESAQEWAGLGAQRKNELLSIPCVARAWSGANDIASARASAFAILAAVEDVVRGDASLGGTVLVTLDGVSSIRLRQASRPTGAIADVSFQIDAKARI